MVKLIRLQGDSDKSETEIRNVFSDGVMIPPKSKLALRSCRVNFLNIEDLQIYRLPTDSVITFEWFIGTSSSLINQITIPGGDYDNTNSLLTEVQKQTNSIWQNVGGAVFLTNLQGCHGRWVQLANRVNFQMYRLPTIDARFARQDGQWINNGLPAGLTGVTLSNGGIVGIGAARTNDLLLKGIYNIPLINSTFECTLTEVNPAGKLEIYAQGQRATTAYRPWGMEVEASGGQQRYKMIINNVSYTVTDVVATSLDVIKIRKFGNRVRFSVSRGGTTVVSVGSEVTTPVGTLDPAGVPPILNDESLTPQLMVWKIKVSSGQDFEIQDAQYQVIGNMGGQGGTTISTNLTLPRANPLGSFLGFTDEVYRATGAPATIIGDQAPIGRSTYPGIMVRVAAPGLDLESYAGVQDRQNQALSFLDVIVPQNIDAISNLIYEPNEMAPLHLKNVAPIELRNLSVQFSRDDTGQPLRFMGQPMVMLALTTPDDD